MLATCAATGRSASRCCAHKDRRQPSTHLVVTIGGAALVLRGPTGAVPVQAEQGAKGAKLEPAHDQLLKHRVGAVAIPVAANVRGPQHGAAAGTRHSIDEWEHVIPR